MSEEIYARWDIELNVTCPHCKEYVNLLDDPDFFYDRGHWQMPYRGKEEVNCPECGEYFNAVLKY